MNYCKECGVEIIPSDSDLYHLGYYPEYDLCGDCRASAKSKSKED